MSTSAAGYLKLLKWARSWGCVRRAGLEGTGTYGAMLREHGIEVLEANRPDRAKRRLQGKSDPTEAKNAARSVLSGETTSVPKTHSGAAEAMRVISVARRSAVKAKTQAINQLRAMLVSAPQDIREWLWKANPEQCIAGCAHLRTLGTSVLLQTLATTLRLLAKRWLCSQRN